MLVCILATHTVPSITTGVTIIMCVLMFVSYRDDIKRGGDVAKMSRCKNDSDARVRIFENGSVHNCF